MQTDLLTEVEERRSKLSDAPPAVGVQGAYKTFRIPHQQYHTLSEALHRFAPVPTTS